MYISDIKPYKEIAAELYNTYIDYYYTCIFDIVLDAVIQSIKDLHDVCNIEDLHKHIKENYI